MLRFLLYGCRHTQKRALGLVLSSLSAGESAKVVVLVVVVVVFANNLLREPERGVRWPTEPERGRAYGFSGGVLVSAICI